MVVVRKTIKRKRKLRINMIKIVYWHIHIDLLLQVKIMGV